MPGRKRTESIPKRFSLLGVLQGLMVSDNLGDVADEIDHLHDLMGLDRPAGNFVEGWTAEDLARVKIREVDAPLEVGNPIIVVEPGHQYLNNLGYVHKVDGVVISVLLNRHAKTITKFQRPELQYYSGHMGGLSYEAKRSILEGTV